MTSDSIHDDPEELPTLDDISPVCGFLIEPKPLEQRVYWELREFGGEVYDSGYVDSSERAELRIRQAFQRLRTQETAIIPIPERRERSQPRTKNQEPGS